MTKQDIINYIDNNITDPLNKQNTADKVRDVLKVILEDSYNGDTELAFNWDRPITRTSWPYNINLGSTNDTIKKGLEAIFFPALAPLASISGGGTREWGDSKVVNLTWSATKQTNPITSIIVDGVAVTPTGNNQNGTAIGNTGLDTDHAFYISVSDGTLTSIGSTSVGFRNKRFWFKNSQDIMTMTDTELSNFLKNSANAINSEFATDRNQPSRSFLCTDEYVYFAYLASYGNASFTVNSLPNSSWEEKTFVYSNSFSYLTTLKLYKSYNKLNSSNPFNIDIN